MKLLTKEILKKLPPLGTGDDLSGGIQIAQAKFFNPTGAGTWYAAEFSPGEGMFFGAAKITDFELGYFSLQELESFRDHRFGLGIERDIYWKPRPLSECEDT